MAIRNKSCRAMRARYSGRRDNKTRRGCSRQSRRTGESSRRHGSSALRTRWTRGCPGRASSTVPRARMWSSRSGLSQGSRTTARPTRIRPAVSKPAAHPTRTYPGFPKTSSCGRGSPAKAACARLRTQGRTAATAMPDTLHGGAGAPAIARDRSRRTPTRWKQPAGLQNVATTSLGHARWGRGREAVAITAAADVLPRVAGGLGVTSTAERCGRAMPEPEATQLAGVAVGGLVACANVRRTMAETFRPRVAPIARGAALLAQATLVAVGAGDGAAADHSGG